MRVLILVFFSILLTSCSNDNGNKDAIKAVREFCQSISESNYKKTFEECICRPEQNGNGIFGYGDPEIKIVQKRFPWTGHKLLRVIEMPNSYDSLGSYELQIDADGKIEKDIILVKKVNGKWCVNLIDQLISEGISK